MPGTARSGEDAGYIYPFAIDCPTTTTGPRVVSELSEVLYDD